MVPGNHIGSHVPQITSVRNPRIQYIRKLYQKKYRDKEGRFAIEGIRLVEEALANGARLCAAFFAPDLFESDRGRLLAERLKERPIDCFTVSRHVLDAIADVATTQGVCAIAEKRQPRLDEILSNPDPLIVVLHDLQDPGNVGTIIRTASAAGASGVILTGSTSDEYNPKTVRATMGAIFSIPIARVASLAELLQVFRAVGISTVAGDAGARIMYFNHNFRRPVAILVGNEGAGLPREILNLVEEAVAIPMPGGAESLNVAVAASLLIYEALRQRINV
ncbi:MAG TPA: RNA methyltransferase [Firmicutes bacterium]|nr:RNA methyltransferase [Bacillota bacterium]